ncbi:AEC family transporter [Kocuria marina]|uniref:AEC family transporter n=1 Tax=Kocuria marina TaxID=223184 RepID=UPI00299F8BE6|nr:AEC family transporter [Kocuria marina]
MMLEALGAIGPLFAVLAIGGIASLMPKMRAAESSLTAFVLYFALPAFLFDAVATAPVSEGVPWSFALIAFGVTALVSVLTWTAGRFSGKRTRPLAAPLALAASYGNVGYLGVPIALSILGPEAGLAAAMGQLIHNLMFMLGYPAVRALSSGGSRESPVSRQMWIAVKKALLTNPITLSVAAGIVVALVDVPLPSPVSDTLGLFGQTAVPLAMFAVGLTLPAAVKGLRDGSVPGFPLILGTIIKMVLLPILTVVIVALLAPSLGSLWSGTLVLMAAMPTSATAYVLSQQEDADPRIVSSMIAVSSIVGVATIPLALSWFVL